VGSAAGAAFGEVIDNNLLRNFRCLTCQHSFGSHKTSRS
jgi:hypothetical protein